MRVPDIIWQPSGKDVLSGVVARRFVSRINEQAAATNIAFFIVDLADIPLDQVLMLTNLRVRGDSGAGQNVTGLRFAIVDDQGNTLHEIATDTTVSAAAGSTALNWQGDVLVFSGERVLCDSTYFGGAVDNSTTGSAHGYLMPRGNFQR